MTSLGLRQKKGTRSGRSCDGGEEEEVYDMGGSTKSLGLGGVGVRCLDVEHGSLIPTSIAKHQLWLYSLP